MKYVVELYAAMAVSVSRALIEAQSRGIAGSPATPAVLTPESRAMSVESRGAASRTRSSRDLQARVEQAARKARSMFRTVDPLAGSTSRKARSSPVPDNGFAGAPLAGERSVSRHYGTRRLNARRLEGVAQEA